jgi:predicted ATPase
MARLTDRLQVGLVVSAARLFVDDVVHLSGWRHSISSEAGLAQPLVALHDPVALATPGATTTA